MQVTRRQIMLSNVFWSTMDDCPEMPLEQALQGTADVANALSQSLDTGQADIAEVLEAVLAVNRSSTLGTSPPAVARRESFVTSNYHRIAGL